MVKYKIAVIMPYYNENKKILARAINSIECQDFDSYCLLTINDNGEQKILPKKIKCNHLDFYLKENVGPGQARQYGLNYVYEHDLADYIVFLDADDFYFQSALTIMYKHITAFKNNVSLGDSVFDNDGVLHVQRSTLQHNWGKIYKTSFLRDNNIHYPSGKASYVNEDVYFSFLLEASMEGGFDKKYFMEKIVIYHDNSYPPEVNLIKDENSNIPTFLNQMVNVMYYMATQPKDKYKYRRFPLMEMYSPYQICAEYGYDMSEITEKIKYCLQDEVTKNNLKDYIVTYTKCIDNGEFNGIFERITDYEEDGFTLNHDTKKFYFKESFYCWCERMNYTLDLKD